MQIRDAPGGDCRAARSAVARPSTHGIDQSVDIRNRGRQGPVCGGCASCSARDTGCVLRNNPVDASWSDGTVTRTGDRGSLDAQVMRSPAHRTSCAAHGPVPILHPPERLIPQEA